MEKKAAPRCLFCNTELRPVTRTIEREPTDEDYLRRKKAREKENGLDGRRQTLLNEGDYDGALRLAQLATNVRRRAPRFFMRDGVDVVSVEIPTGAYGRDGNGFFCTRRCGESFGVEAAIQGFRIKTLERIHARKERAGK